MFKNYIKLAWRNLFKNRLYSFLNILGLGSGMAMAILIGLWLVDQLSVNKYNEGYDRIGLIQKNRFYNNSIFTETSNPIPLGERLRNEFPDDFEKIIVSSYGGEKSLRYGESTVLKRGLFMEPGGQSILGLKVIEGSRQEPMNPSSILISESVSKALFGEKTGIGEVIRLDENIDANVAGIFQDLPKNSTFRNVNFYGTFALYENTAWWIKNSHDDWEGNAFPIYVKLAQKSDFKAVSQKIEKTLFNETQDASNPKLFIHAMSKWHLYPEFKEGKAVGTGLNNVWLFGAIGFLILLLATINFMNLSTARS
ncbi:MAG: putative ABC transport system permease protein [Arcticibacterium sp.]|jgi:putative ABC transport system permease protein